MFVLPLPLENTPATLEQSEGGLAKPQLYVVVNGIPTKKKVIWRSLVDVNKSQSCCSNWLFSDVDQDKVEKTGDEIVIDVAHSATSTLLEKVSDKDEYCAGLQDYTIRHLDKPVPTGNNIDQFKMVNVKEFPLKSNQKHLDLMCFPELLTVKYLSPVQST